MPELPEVETVRRGLEPAMVGARFVAVDQRRPDLRFPFPDRFAERLGGRRVEGLGRRAKYLLATLDDANVLVMHLGMSGSFHIDEGAVGRFHHARGKDAAHDHVVFRLSNGATITYNDPRRFGFMQLVPAGELGSSAVCQYRSRAARQRIRRRASGAALRRKVGLPEGCPARPEPDCRIGQYLRLRSPASRRPVAAAGGRDARSPGRKLRQSARIFWPRAFRQVLEEALAAGGSSLRDHQRTDGTLGYFQHSFRVYDREGAGCPTQGCRVACSASCNRGGRRFFAEGARGRAEANGYGGSFLEQIGVGPVRARAPMPKPSRPFGRIPSVIQFQPSRASGWRRPAEELETALCP